MPTYETLPEGSNLVQNKTLGFLIIPISDNIDAGLWWQKAGGAASGKLKATLQKQDGSNVNKTAADGELALDNTAPQKVKVLFIPADLDQVGSIKVLVEFKFDDSWLQAETVTVPIIDDPVPG